MAGGRPTDYSQEVVDQALQYLEHYESPPYNNKVPSIVGLCRAIKRARSTVYLWAKDEDKQEFSDIVRQVAEYQEEKLIDKGLDGTFNASITKLMLGKHGYKDQSALTGADGKPLIPDNTSDMELARRAVFLMTKVLKDAEDSD